MEEEQASGADYLAVAAQRLAEAWSQERQEAAAVADLFRRFVMSAYLPAVSPVGHRITARPIEDREAVAVAVINVALEMARDHLDTISVDEIVRQGSLLLMRWHEYLDLARPGR